MFVPILVLCLLNVVLSVPIKPEYNLENANSLFNDFKIKYGRSYGSSENVLRFKYFVNSLVKINELNEQNPLAVFDINKFSDWSPEELKSLRCFSEDYGQGDGACKQGTAISVNGTAAGSLDWRDKNAVTPVHDQQGCGSCWAFGTTVGVEGAHAIKNKQLLDLSEQQLVDCDTQSSGCNGGLPHHALSYLINFGGQEAEADYPYVAKDQQCSADASKAKVRVTGCTLYYPSAESNYEALVNIGPLPIAIDSHALTSYQSGILTQCSYQALDHAVAIVGYGTENGTPFWIIKNSWDTTWGEQGYARVVRGQACLGLGQYAVTVEVA